MQDTFATKIHKIVKWILFIIAMSNHSEHPRSGKISEDKLEEELRKTDPRLKENKIILITVLNPLNSLNVDVIHRICKSNGKVIPIVKKMNPSLSVFVHV